jgi:RecA-family ATPase
MQEYSRLQEGHIVPKCEVTKSMENTKMDDCNTLNNMMEAALDYAEQGIPIFICKPNGKSPLTPNGFKDATTDPEIIKAWLKKHPDANIATPTGTNQGIGVTIDIDGADNLWPKKPDSQLSLDKGVSVDTPNGGSHYHFLLPEGKSWRTSASKVFEKVDIRGKGGYVLLPPSIINGIKYAYRYTDTTLNDLTEPDTWVMSALDFIDRERDDSPTNSELKTSGNSIPEGRRNDNLTRYAGLFKRYDFNETELFKMLQTINQERCKPPLNDQEVHNIIKSSRSWKSDQVSVNNLSIPVSVDDGIVTIDFSRLLDEPAPSIEYIFEGMLPKGILSGLDGQGGLGKSNLIQELVMSLACGKALIDSFVPSKPMKVLWCQGEDNEEEIHRRTKKIQRAFQLTDADEALCGSNIKLHLMHAHPLVKPEDGTMITTENFERIKQDVIDFQPELVVLDPRSGFYAGLENENSQMAHFMGSLRSLTKLVPGGSTILMAHHTSKANQDTMDSSSGRGASAARDAQRATFGMIPITTKTEADRYGVQGDWNNYVLLGHTKANLTARHGQDILLQRETGENGGVLKEVSIADMKAKQAETKLKATAKALVDLVEDNPHDYSVNDFYKDSGCKKFREDLKAETGATKIDIRPAFELAIDKGWLIVDRKSVEGRNKPKEVPRAVVAEVSK